MKFIHSIIPSVGHIKMKNHKGQPHRALHNKFSCQGYRRCKQSNRIWLLGFVHPWLGQTQIHAIVIKLFFLFLLLFFFFSFMLDYDFKVVPNHQAMPKEQYYQKHECWRQSYIYFLLFIHIVISLITLTLLYLLYNIFYVNCVF